MLSQVGDDGSVLAATEDDVFQSLVGGLDNGLSSYDPEGSDPVGDDDDEGSDYVASDGDDSSGRANISKLLILVHFDSWQTSSVVGLETCCILQKILCISSSLLSKI